MEPRRKSTSTSNFGVGRRESHDATDFYARFTPPGLSLEAAVNPPTAVDRIYCADARHMPEIAPSSVALVVTSPPYFAGKEYEEALGHGHVPATYLEYLEMLHDVFAECADKLEPGGRIAVNVANLGRKPYRSLAADIVSILQDRLGLLLRGEIVWQKARGAGGSCAWGSFQSPANPVLRDLTERVVVAAKGRFDRALSRRERALHGLPCEPTISRDDFMEATTDVWEIPPESANRVGHPAPFPVELPRRLIELYTYKDDLVLDPFLGSGSTAVAAVRAGRHYVGYDTDAGYVEAARERVAQEVKLQRVAEQPPNTRGPDDSGFAAALEQGRRATEAAAALLEDCGFRIVEEKVRFKGGIEISFAATDLRGRRWLFDVSGAFTITPTGLRRQESLWRALGKAAVLRQATARPAPLILLTTDLPAANSPGDATLRSVRGGIYHDAIEMLAPAGQERLRLYARGEGRKQPIGDLLDPADARQP